MRGQVLCVVLVALAACGQSEEGKPGAQTESAKRQLAPKFHEVARGFGDAVIAKHYERAFTFMASSYQREAGYDEFLKSITRYRDHVEGKVTVKVRASDDDPTTLKDDGVVQLFVPEPYRAQLLDEAILNFDLEDGSGWVLVMWFVEEAGAMRILQFYQDD